MLPAKSAVDWEEPKRIVIYGIEIFPKSISTFATCVVSKLNWKPTCSPGLVRRTFCC